MNVPSPRRLQYGYLLEIPIMLMVGGAVVATLFFHLPPVGQKVLVCGMALPLLCCLYYVIVAPGWMADKAHLKPTLRLLAFLLLTAMIGTGVSIFILGE
ncbi:MAG: hypothetical protein KBF29_12585 [Sterolibacterium sp.]|jgi:hypothetical protein|nr:hypothetical protein [Sterolibacterium sp.]